MTSNGRRGWNGNEGPTASFLREFPEYSGTRLEYRAEHARLYGPEENLAPDGTHPPGKHPPRFPKDSPREMYYDMYDVSTKPRDNTRIEYRVAHNVAMTDRKPMTKDERTYYKNNTGGLTPLQHEYLHPLAHRWEQETYDNATGREIFIEKFPIGYHTKDAAEEHRKYTKDAYVEYEDAHGNRVIHERYRSDVAHDRRRDQFKRPVPRYP